MNHRMRSVMLSLSIVGATLSACSHSPSPTPTEPSLGLTLSAPTTLLPGEEVAITAEVLDPGPFTFHWYADGGEILGGQNSPTVIYRAPQTEGVYTLRLEVGYDGQTLVKSLTVQVVTSATDTPVSSPTSVPTATSTVTSTPSPSAPTATSTTTPTPSPTPAPTAAPPPAPFLRVVLPDPAICSPPPPGAPPGDCGLAITVRWDDIKPDSGRIYLLASVGGDVWWVAGTGIPPTEPTGQAAITDGSFSQPAQIVTLFACLTNENYPPGQNFTGRPACTLSSPDVFVQTQAP